MTTDIDSRVLDIFARSRQAQERYNAAALRMQRAVGEAQADMRAAQQDIEAAREELGELIKAGLFRP